MNAATAQMGSTVKVHYLGMLPDGTIFDRSNPDEPLEFTLGAGEVIPGFEKAVLGMRVGERRRVTIPAASAYGERQQAAMLSIPREQFPQEIDPQPGMRLGMHRGDGKMIPVLVAEVTDAYVLIDANHPLAGHDLTFEIELVEA